MLQTFEQFLKEAKDSQKEVENKDLHGKDASHGDKPDVLDTKINEEKDDCEFRESLNEALSGMDAKFIETNKDRSVGERALGNAGKEMPFVIITNSGTTLFIAHKRGSTVGCIVYDKTNNTKAEVIISKEAFEQFKKLF